MQCSNPYHAGQREIKKDKKQSSLPRSRFKSRHATLHWGGDRHKDGEIQLMATNPLSQDRNCR